MRKKKLILFVSSLVLLTGFFLLPRNREWAGLILSYYRDYPSQRKHLDRESRMRLRFARSYTFSKNITDQLKGRNNNQPVLVLMPPPGYFTQAGISYDVPEPAVFYYYTGLKTIWANSKQAITANWYVHVQDKKIIADSVTDKKTLQDTITAFQKWKYPL